MGKLKLKCSHLLVKAVLLWPCTTLMRYSGNTYTLFQLHSQLLVLLVIKLHISPLKYSPSVLLLRHQ